MENATKALLIAAAVLVAILIISLGIGVFNMASESMEGADLTAQQVQAFNQEFLNYEGTNKRASTVNALVSTAFNHNLNETDSTREVTVNLVKGGTTTTLINSGTTSLPNNISSGALYDISITTYTSAGLASIITVTQK